MAKRINGRWSAAWAVDIGFNVGRGGESRVMVMSDHLLEVIAGSSDRAWLEKCRDHNAKLEKKNVVEAVSRRLRDLDLQDALRVKPDAHSVEERVLEGVRVYRELLKHKHARDQAAEYTVLFAVQFCPPEPWVPLPRW